MFPPSLKLMKCLAPQLCLSNRRSEQQYSHTFLTWGGKNAGQDLLSFVGHSHMTSIVNVRTVSGLGSRIFVTEWNSICFLWTPFQNGLLHFQFIPQILPQSQRKFNPSVSLKIVSDGGKGTLNDYISIFLGP